MSEATLLLAAIFSPLFGALCLAAPPLRRFARAWALVVVLFTLVLAALVVAEFPASGTPDGDYAVTDWAWLGGGPLPDIRFSVGLDGLGVWLFGLSALLLVTAVLVSWEAVQHKAGLFFAMLLLLEFGCLGVFAARDIILFYVFFEFTLIPLFFLIGIWGSEQRRFAAIKFFLFTLAGSMLTFLGLLAIVVWDYTHADVAAMRFSISTLTESLRDHPIEPVTVQLVVFAALFAGFAIKVPLFPLHTWLPLAHVQAPTAGSVLLAGVMLKIGTYGFVRFSLPMLPQASAIAMPWIFCLSVIGIIYGALVALAQTDIKRLVAYSSVSHLGYCMLGLFAFNAVGIQGGTLQMVNHGLSTGALFAIVGMLYERYHTRDMDYYGGLARRMPWLTFFMVLFTFSSIGLPGLNGFVGEFMVLLAAFQRAWVSTPPGWQLVLRVASVLAVAGVVLGAWYMLSLVQRVFFGPLREPVAAHRGGAAEHPVSDLNWREILALAPLAAFVVWIGLQPKFFLDRMEPTLNPIAAAVDRTWRDQVGTQHAGGAVAPSVEEFASGDR